MSSALAMTSSLTPDSTPIRLSKSEMRELFNKHILGDLQSGKYKEEVATQRHANPFKSGQVLCTFSQMILIKDENDLEIAIAHRYKRPTSEAGASGLPDPVKIDWDGKTYKLRQKE